ncbi:transketolase [Niabella yanshanensis]|uniref:Transketolase n=1 Tax=Niabella yanshanensis TaxID=577386 RepID=A0ABZ0W689_9BACT|nr:transketolase [Niabella yanshanensis]WQD38706.1 transketolase [Niabella yanshanensis]
MSRELSIAGLEDLATQVRRDIVRMVHGCQSGHPGGSLGCTDFLVALYFKIMNHDTSFSMEGVNEDLFFLSNGHISPLLYAVLARSGYFDPAELSTFRKINSRLQGHPTTHEGLPGIRMSSGSLGQGLSVAIGAAITKKRRNETSLVFSLHGDGELQEGQIWEAALFAPAKKIDNLVVTIDVNGQQIDGSTNDVLSLGDLRAKWMAFGWEVIELEGNNMKEIVEALTFAKSRTFRGKPIVILMHTNMGHGVSFMTGSHKWHGIAPNDEQLNMALSELSSTLSDY